MSDPDTDVQLIDKKGLRLDGRKLDELRPIKIEVGVLKRADGSCYLEWGENKVIVGVYGPREVHPRHMQNPMRGIVQARYNMVSFSVSERKRPGPDRRSSEISKLLSEALEHVVLTDRFPRTTVDVYIEVVQASAGTRCAGLTAASVALADAGIPMRDLIASVASGKVGDKLVLDLGQKEDNFGQADVPFAMVGRTGEVVLLQMDGHLTIEEFDTIMEMNRKASLEVYEIQKAALQDRYSSFTEEGEAEPDAPEEEKKDEKKEKKSSPPPKADKEPKDAKESKEPKDAKKPEDAKKPKEPKDAKESKEPKDAKKPEEPKEPKDAKEEPKAKGEKAPVPEEMVEEAIPEKDDKGPAGGDE
jgi:exosome complex component RRP41